MSYTPIVPGSFGGLPSPGMLAAESLLSSHKLPGVEPGLLRTYLCLRRSSRNNDTASEWLVTIQRPLASEASALPTELHPDKSRFSGAARLNLTPHNRLLC